MSKPIPPLDLMWLIMETQASPTHVGALLLFEKPKGRPTWSARSSRPTGPASRRRRSITCRRLGGTGLPHFREATSYDPHYHIQHIALPDGRHVRRPAATRGRPARADARPRPAAVPQLDHRRRAGQPVRHVHEGAPRHHRRRVRHEAALREPEPEPEARDPDARVRAPKCPCASRARRRPWSTAWPNSASPRPSRRSRCGTSRSAPSRKGSRRCSAPTRSAAHRSRRSAGR